jgi:hypothetical protein
VANANAIDRRFIIPPGRLGNVCPTAFEDDSVADLESGIKGLADKIRRASFADEVAAFTG